MTTERTTMARNLMTGGYNCAQSLAIAFADETGIDEKKLVHLAFPFGGGFGRQGLMCGAVSGAVMVLGSVAGPRAAEDPAQYRDTMYRLTQDYLARFRKGNGSFLCRDLLKLDLSDPAQAQQAREAGVFTTLCPAFVESAAEILEEMLGELKRAG
jgi:C_GCAxxG_C_C family probable redox protein